MTTADDLGYNDDDDPGQDEAAQKRAAFERRKSEREAERKELAELRDFKAKTDRDAALTEAKAALNATGPLAAFLKNYDGEPTADAIRKAIEADDDFKTLVTFSADPRDVAAQVQNDGAARLRGADPVAGRALEPNIGPGVGRLEHAYASTPKT